MTVLSIGFRGMPVIDEVLFANDQQAINFLELNSENITHVTLLDSAAEPVKCGNTAGQVAAYLQAKEDEFWFMESKTKGR